MQILLYIGAWASISDSRSHRLNNELLEQETLIGSVKFGKIGNGINPFIERTVNTVKNFDFRGLEKFVRRFWEIEDFPPTTKKSIEHELRKSLLKNIQEANSVRCAHSTETNHCGHW